ncbi:PQQ-binding-like beta-propeller repeat protein [Nocardia colli]|uniref:PQQ-binding-like beta-propeller repeat protein n=1 Tax=Nocardia colli TaxID=2545717 RepID=A0A5N0EL21_9NOCA|nr:PQQ-binding-like beta-propeller repeat protein [Nocardia colli]KAA8888974.1 PQQ-binding-like beta-propeller repeat protein [Nocardia colli]
MKSIPGLRGLLLAATAAVITSAGAVFVLIQPDDGTRKITGTADAAPGLGWSVAAATDGHPKAEFRNPVGGTEFDVGSAGFVEAGDTLITVTGTSNGDMALQDPTMVGIDATTGAVRWRTPAADLGGCGRVPVDGRLVCFSVPVTGQGALVGFDIGSGEITRTPTDWLVFALATTADRVYIAEGDVESDDVRVHAGTLARPEANWSRAFPIGTLWEDVSTDALDVTHGQGLLTLGAHVAGFDLGTGEPTLTADLAGCASSGSTSAALVIRTKSGCSGNGISGTDILDRTGRVLAASDVKVTHSLTLDQPADDTIPVLLGDSARDRRTGAVVWTSADLVAVNGTATAVLGDVALLRDDVAHKMTGLDMRTGRRLWQIDSQRSGTADAWDGHVVVLSDSTGLWAMDPKTGKTIWDIPFRAVNDKPEAITGGGQLAARNNGSYVYASAHTMIGLRPIDH